MLISSFSPLTGILREAGGEGQAFLKSCGTAPVIGTMARQEFASRIFFQQILGHHALDQLVGCILRGVRFFRNDTINSSFPVPSIALFGQPFFPPGTSFKGTRTEGISANVAW